MNPTIHFDRLEPLRSCRESTAMEKLVKRFDQLVSNVITAVIGALVISIFILVWDWVSDGGVIDLLGGATQEKANSLDERISAIERALLHNADAK